MATILNADTVVGGAIVTGDASGELALQAAGVTKLTVAAGGVTLATPLPVGSGGTGATSLSGITVGTATSATTATNLAGGSNGTIPYQSAAGTTQMLAVGTAGQVLQTNGAGAPTWVTPSGGGAVTIASGSFPAAASLSITNIPATYGQLVLQITGASTTSSGFINIQVSTDNGSSFDTTVASYQGSVLDGSGVAAITRATLEQGNNLAAAEFTTGVVNIFSYQGGAFPQFMGRTSNSTNDKQMSIGTYTGSTSAINALRINWSNGNNFDAGTYLLQGVS
jgi:hypothetical protein